MNDAGTLILLLGGGVLVVGHLLILGWVLYRVSQRRPLVPYEPRREVPWTPADLFVVILLGLFAMMLPALLAGAGASAMNVAPAAEDSGDASQEQAANPASDEPAEFLPDGTPREPADGTSSEQPPPEKEGGEKLSGEKGAGEKEPDQKAVETNSPKNDVDQETLSPRQLRLGLLGRALAVLFVGAYLMLGRGATWSDLGLSAHGFWSDVRLGMGAFLLIAVPLYLVTILVHSLVDTRHQLLEQLYDAGFQSGLFILAILSAVVAAPLAEEFFFRAVIQGGLERLESLRIPLREVASETFQPTRYTEAGEIAETGETGEAGETDETAETGEAAEATDQPGQGPRGVFPIVATSLFFAMMHLGAGLDPIPLFMFSLVLGYLYHRTHRLLPCIILHMSLNSCTMLMLLLELLTTQEG